MVSRFALELTGKSYGLPASSNAGAMVIRLADGCSEGPRCNCTQSKALKMQRGPFEHPSASRLVMRFALELAGKSYGLLARSNASRMVIWLADGCSKESRCNFTQSKALKTQRGPFEHPSASRMVSRLALELAGKSYGLPASSNASRMVIRLADGCSKGPHCNFTQSKALKTQREPSDHPSASRMVSRFALELADKSYALPASSNNASHIIIRLADECLEDLSSTHRQAVRSRLALELASKSYGLPTSSNANRMDFWFETAGLVSSVTDSGSGLSLASFRTGVNFCNWLVPGLICILSWLAAQILVNLYSVLVTGLPLVSFRTGVNFCNWLVPGLICILSWLLISSSDFQILILVSCLVQFCSGLVTANWLLISSSDFQILFSSGLVIANWFWLLLLNQLKLRFSDSDSG
ncbi:hypothetical protein L7F22_036640 [Adiantum nelumboides]|nr:hypothetical protein [Adiantum nelumboides]